MLGAASRATGFHRRSHRIRCFGGRSRRGDHQNARSEPEGEFAVRKTNRDTTPLVPGLIIPLTEIHLRKTLMSWLPHYTARVARLGESRDVSEGEFCPLRSVCLGVLEAKRARLPSDRRLGYADGNASKMEVPEEVICRE